MRRRAPSAASKLSAIVAAHFENRRGDLRMAYEGLMVSVSGVRGRVGEALTPEIVAKFAAGFGSWALARSGSRGKPRIVVGRDSRVSGPMFQSVVRPPLQSVGCELVIV